jgi:hypothetical protein
VSSRAEIGGNFSSHFTNIFSTSNPPIDSKMMDLFSPIITEEENVILSSIPTEGEVVEALSSLGTTKAPGPDGYTALFYRKYWDFVKKEVLQSIWHFFQNNTLTRNQNHSFIALIPKISGSHTVNQFRPISLCNIVYKIISKILANRLKVHLLGLSLHCNLHLCLTGTYKTIPFWLMNSFILSNPKEANEGLCS